MREQDKTITDLGEALEVVNQLLSASSAATYLLEYGKREGPYERSLAELQGILDKSPDKDAGLWYVTLIDEQDNQHTVAITGNGLHSEANAKLMAAAPQIIRYLIGQIAELKSGFEWLERNRVHMQNYDVEGGVSLWWNSTPEKPRMVHGDNILDAIKRARQRDKKDFEVKI